MSASFPHGLRARTVRAALAALCAATGVALGYGAAKYGRAAVPARTSVFTDFRVPIPEGETVVTISDPSSDGETLARLSIVRQGDRVEGVPQTLRHFEPRQPLNVEDADFFRRELAGVFSPSDTAWEKANKIREWLTRVSRNRAMPGLATRVPREAYEEMQRGRPVLCGNLAQIYAALCEAAGLTARPVGFDLLVRDGRFGGDAHAGTEVWLPEFGGWVYEDPTFDCYWKVEGRPASALTLHDALMDGRAIELGDACANESASRNYVDPRLYFRHLSYEYRPGGDLLYYADERVGPINFRDRYWAQTDERSALARLDTDGNVFVERRGEVAPGVFVQVIGRSLFIRDRREGAEQGLRVRSSRGAIELPAYEQRRAEELGLFSGANLVRNGSFRLKGSSDIVARDWSVSGPVDGVTLLGGQGMAAAAGGSLRQQVRVTPGKHYLLYAKLLVTRGEVCWTVGDASPGPASVGGAEPGRVSEVVSDAVPSASGYLNVSFEARSDAAFRVMDVIVVEAPTFKRSESVAVNAPGSTGPVKTE